MLLAQCSFLSRNLAHREVCLVVHTLVSTNPLTKLAPAARSAPELTKSIIITNYLIANYLTLYLVLVSSLDLRSNRFAKIQHQYPIALKIPPGCNRCRASPLYRYLVSDGLPPAPGTADLVFHVPRSQRFLFRSFLTSVPKLSIFSRSSWPAVPRYVNP